MVLDSGTGLGYTAITASKTADKVITIEFDENVIKISRLNPYSQDLLTKKNIQYWFEGWYCSYESIRTDILKWVSVNGKKYQSIQHNWAIMFGLENMQKQILNLQ